MLLDADIRAVKETIAMGMEEVNLWHSPAKQFIFTSINIRSEVEGA